MNAVDTGAAQLPDFQRGWVWDDGRIRALILSVIHNFPVGAAMFLEYGNESIHFKHKPIEGSGADPNTEPDELILDGQQRLTSLYNALYSKNPVHTKTDKGKEIERFYYLDIEKALDPSADDEDVVVSIPATRQVTSDFGTSNRDPAQWKENFCENDALLCALDRIFDDAVVFTIKGESFRGRKLETVALRTSTGSPADPQQAGYTILPGG